LNGRVAFLEKLLARKSIFYTKYFYDTYEVQARRNITESIMEVKKPQEPDSIVTVDVAASYGHSYTDAQMNQTLKSLEDLTKQLKMKNTFSATRLAGVAKEVHENRNYFLNPNSGLKGYYLRGNLYGGAAYTLYYEDGSKWPTDSLDWLVLE
jgi:hypothetical protein